ncbi:1085_t:CDS:10 [Paraglomus occultum]|uniref:1085_t:CDS:1 n=1 Tax=Paraglomus occultum TaxID=144539 RepID=A0A9N9GHQ4_9GLOM|nr:1085_t:CDS:10 [Paraglomus occultum]
MNASLDQKLHYLETLCQEVYNPKSQEQRENAEKLLDCAFPTFSDSSSAGANSGNTSPILPNPLGVHIHTPAESSAYCQWLLKNSASPYAQMFASGRLKTLVTDHFSMFTMQQKLDLSTNPEYQPFVISSLAQLFAAITRAGWSEGDEFRLVTNDLSNFLQATVDHKIVGLQILGIVVSDINQASIAGRNINKLRKTAVSFRDQQLLKIFQLGMANLRQILHREVPYTKSNQDSRIKEACLTLLRNCLAFDFIGTIPDESGEDIGSIQVPMSWRQTVEEPTFLQTLFDCYKQFQPPPSSQVMEVLVQVSSIRRSLFNEDERSKFLFTLMQGTSEILLTSIGLENVNNYHEFCRLLSRFRSTHQCNEITEKPGYGEWLDLVANFSVKGFQAWQWAPNSVQYLLTFWSKMLSSTGASNATTSRLERIAPQLMRAYVVSRIDSVNVDGGAIDDLLDNEDAQITEFELLATIARYKYDDCSAVIMETFDPIASTYQNLMTQASTGVGNSSSSSAMEAVQTKFAWLVYMIGGLVGGRQTYISSEEQDYIDGELSCKVLQLMNVNQSWNAPNVGHFGCEKLELSFVYFFGTFRKSYIGDNSHKVSKVFGKLSENFAIHDQTMLLNVIVQKLATNLKMWANSPQIILRSINLLNDFAAGYLEDSSHHSRVVALRVNFYLHSRARSYSSVRLLRKLETVQYIIQNHSIKSFPFLGVPENFRNRMKYYAALSKILFADENPELDFDEFIKPWDETLRELETFNTLSEFRQPVVKDTLMGVLYDLRGFLSALQGRKQFTLFFDWFYPNHSEVLLHALEAWADDRLAIGILKFYLEFVNNKAQRLNFEVSSPNGILIFREASKVINAYGRQTLARPSLGSDKYADKYKGITVCFLMLTRCFGGRYVNFGVFELYGDKALEVALSTMFELILSIPFEDLMEYPKLCRAFFQLMEMFTNEHMTTLRELNSNVFLFTLNRFLTLSNVIHNVANSAACIAVDNICTFVVQQMAKQKPNQHWLLVYLSQYSHILPYMLAANFGMVLFEDRQNQWSLSRPLLGLILLNREYFFEYTQLILQLQLPERRETLAKALTALMEDFEWNLTSKNRDRFTQNLCQFKRELSTHNVVLVQPPSDNKSIM